MTGPLLSADVAVERGAFSLEASLTAGAREVVAVLGPNGAGKSTLLRALAGLEPLRSGRISLDGRVLDDPAEGTWVAPERRGVGVVFQDHLLFPHLTALDNVAFGLRARGAGRAAARAAAQDELSAVGLADVAHLRPRQLSGGQAQRVAVARALATRPGLLLLDEPLAALDASTRLRVRGDLQRRVRAYGGATVVVTHDPLDALVLADRLVVVEGGRVVQEGRTADVARHPRTPYVAHLVGLNLWRGRAAADGGVTVGAGLHLVAAEPADPGEVLVAVPPSAVALYPSRPEGSPRNAWPCTVSSVEVQGSLVRVALDGPVAVLADVTPAATADLALAPGRPVWAVVKANEVRAYTA